MSLRLHNSLTRQVELFAPLDRDCPTMYLCGPTVYNYVHIGNARGPVVFGVLAALLRRRYGRLKYARNITDVDDKINAAATALGTPISTITDKYAAAYREDMAMLGVTGDFAPDIEPEATAHIPQMIAMIQRLIDQGHAYAAEGHVLFAVDTYAEYGKLSRRDPEDMLAGARVEVAPYKRNPGDFVLWKPSTEDLPGWESPWSVGRPGWHIECSAMAETHLGDTIDIHAGGIDLQFPHHENEVAQSECAHKHDDGSHKTFSRWWIHNGMLNFGGSKMAKSVGNIQRVHDLVREHPPEALRYALLSAHYRQPLEWSDGLIEQAVRTLDGLYRTLQALSDIQVMPEIPDTVESILDDDLNTPQALAEIASLNRKAKQLFGPPGGPGSERTEELNSQLHQAKAHLLGAGLALGLLQQTPESWFSRGDFLAEKESELINKLRLERRKAKTEKDYARADKIRNELRRYNVEIKDLPDGTDQITTTIRLTEGINFSSEANSRTEGLEQIIERLDVK